MSKPANGEHKTILYKQSVSSRLWCMLQGLVPQFFLTRIAARLSAIRWKPFKNAFIKVFVKIFSIDMTEAERGSVASYENFDDFFTRELRSGIRPLAGAGHLCCPVDGAISQAGKLDDESILQFKGMHYNLSELFAGYSDLAEPFVDGSFICMYLAPSDYHRVHAPVDGQLQDLLHVPGKLFGVGQASVRYIPKLFSRNERLLMLFDSKYGKMAVIMVGACMVGSIDTEWTGKLPIDPGQVNHTRPDEGKGGCQQGDYIARFNYGSTVIVLTEPERLKMNDELTVNGKIVMGQSLGTLHR